MLSITINPDDLAGGLVLVIDGVEIVISGKLADEQAEGGEDDLIERVAMPANVRRIMPWEFRRDRQPG